MTPTTIVTIPLRTGRGLNSREHHMTRSARVKRERYAVGMSLNPLPRPALPCVVMLEREARGTGRLLDDDNLQGALKAVRDEVARWLGVDDADKRVRWLYYQTRAREWGVTVTVQTDDQGVQ